MKKTNLKSHCPIHFAMEIFGDRWSFLIIRDLMFKGKQHYVEFLASEEKIATNILANRLLSLEHSGIIIKSVDQNHGSKFIYQLTKKGIDLLPTLVEIILWSAKYDKASAVDKSFLREAKSDKEGLIKKQILQLSKI